MLWRCLIGGFSRMATLYGLDFGDHFGAALAMTENTLVVGAPMVDAAGIIVNVGRAYLFRRSGDRWTYVARLGASSPHVADRFGASVGIIGNDVLVGAPGRDGANVNSGAVYLFPGLIPLLADGFESGSISGWSSTVP